MARRTIAERLAEARNEGYHEGYTNGRANALSTLSKASDARVAQLQMMDAVTKLVSVTGQTIGSLSQVFDNGPRP